METVLVVDDERFFLTLASDALSQEGYRVLTAESGAAALKLLEEEPVRVVVLDVVMPGLDGLDVLPLIKRLKPEVQVIMVSGKVDLGSREALTSLRQWAFEFMKKPLNLDEFCQVVERAIERSRLDEEQRRHFRQLERLTTGSLELANMIRWDTLGLFLRDSNLLFQKVIDLIALLLEVEIVSLMLLDEGTQTLRIAYAMGLSEDLKRSTMIRVGDGIAGWVAKEGEPLLIEDFATETRFKESSFHPQYTTRSLLSVPLKVNGKVIGVLNANNKISGDKFDEYDLTLLTTFSCLVALGFANAQLFDKLASSVDEVAKVNKKLVRANLELQEKVKELEALRELNRAEPFERKEA
ncbi:MAG: response regulator [candidate division NC10 bacterium]|nr:response regulator [candidate division NC10 bacterium]